MLKKSRNLFGKIFYPLVLLFVIGDGLLVFSFIKSQTEHIETSLITEHIFICDIISSQIENSYEKGEWPFATLKKLSDDSEHVIFWRIVRPDGKIETASDIASRGQYLGQEEIVGKVRVEDEKSPAGRENTRTIIYPLSIKDSKGQWTFWLGLSLESVEEASRQLISISVLVGFIIFFVLVLFSFSLAHRIAGPIKKLAAAAEIIGTGRLDYFIEKETEDEVGVLTDAFNKMVNTLKQNTVSLNFFNNIIETMGDALIVTDAGGKIELINCSAIELLRYGKDELLNKNFSIIFSDKFSADKENFEKSELNFWEGLWKARDGTAIPVLCSRGFVRDESKSVTNIVYVAKDITDIKKAEQDILNAYKKLKETQEYLIQSEKMAAIGRLAGGIAHEIRNPLAIIMQGIHLVEVMVCDKTDDVKDSIEMIKSSVKRTNEVISRLLNYSRSARLKAVPEDIREVIDEGIAIVENEIKLRNIEIKRRYSENPVRVLLDRITLTQAFLNLISNAVDAMDKGGTITIEVKTEGTSCIVIFTDTGRGINKENIKKMFEPFFTTKPSGKGTGLGLAMVELIVKRHDGTVFVESEENKGAKFTMKFALAA